MFSVLSNYLPSSNSCKLMCHFPLARLEAVLGVCGREKGNNCLLLQEDALQTGMISRRRIKFLHFSVLGRMIACSEWEGEGRMGEMGAQCSHSALAPRAGPGFACRDQEKPK